MEAIPRGDKGTSYKMQLVVSDINIVSDVIHKAGVLYGGKGKGNRNKMAQSKLTKNSRKYL